MSQDSYIIDLSDLKMTDVEKVGGKNASLGEMIQHLTQAGVKIPGGFATTAHAFWQFLKHNNLKNKIDARLQSLDVSDVAALADVGSQIRQWVMEAPLPETLEQAITEAYNALCARDGNDMLSVAVRSSATAEDLPDASFAGQQETYLNICGADAVLMAVRQVFASLYNDRAIAYRVHQGFEHSEVALSVGVQRMVRSDKACSGVMFSIDTESGFSDVVFITSAYGLGETVVQGAVNPDEFYVYKPALAQGKEAILRKNLGSKLEKMIFTESGAPTPVTVINVDPAEQAQFSLNNDDIEQLARYAVLIEQHYGRPMDIEWAKDGNSGDLLIVQARPETVKSRNDNRVIERYALQESSEIRAQGRAIGQRIGAGVVRIVNDVSEMARVEEGDVLVTDMTDPDWEPVMQRAQAIVTNRGGRTCHAAIIARELGTPAVVGCGDATRSLSDGELVTVSCAEGDEGHVYADKLEFSVNRVNVNAMPELPFKIMMNVANPDRAFNFRQLPHCGVGLARLEFIINRMIGVHPKALLDFAQLPSEVKEQVEKLTSSYASPVDYYVDRLAEGIACIAAAFAPERVIFRLSDFKSNEYANLLGGHLYEPEEENPMLGFRGASRYLDASFRDCFELECRAVKKVRENMGLTNIEVMIPFVRTPEEGRAVIELLAEFGLKRGENGLRVIMMCELPSNALLADAFLQHFDGFSIGSNDMTQLTLGLDRDSSIIAHLFDERDDAVKALLHQAIKACKKAGKYIGICGQGPSDHPDFARWLMQEGIDSVSLNPDSVLETWLYLAENA